MNSAVNIDENLGPERAQEIANEHARMTFESWDARGATLDPIRTLITDNKFVFLNRFSCEGSEILPAANADRELHLLAGRHCVRVTQGRRREGCVHGSDLPGARASFDDQVVRSTVTAAFAQESKKRCWRLHARGLQFGPGRQSLQERALALSAHANPCRRSSATARKLQESASSSSTLPPTMIPKYQK